MTSPTKQPYQRQVS